MANELDWLRAKAKHVQTDTMTITPDEAAEVGDCEPGEYRIERYAFEGNIPFRMARALRGIELIKTDTESEVLHLGNGYRGGEGICRYYRSTYERLTA